MQEQNTLTDFWEAWIEINGGDTKAFGTLYVFGEAKMDKSEKAVITRCPHLSKGELVLHLNTTVALQKPVMKEVRYSEPVHMPGEYKTIVVYQNQTLIARIGRVEMVV